MAPQEFETSNQSYLKENCVSCPLPTIATNICLSDSEINKIESWVFGHEMIYMSLTGAKDDGVPWNFRLFLKI